MPESDNLTRFGLPENHSTFDMQSTKVRNDILDDTIVFLKRYTNPETFAAKYSNYFGDFLQTEKLLAIIPYAAIGGLVGVFAGINANLVSRNKLTSGQRFGTTLNFVNGFGLAGLFYIFRNIVFANKFDNYESLSSNGLSSIASSALAGVGTGAVVSIARVNTPTASMFTYLVYGLMGGVGETINQACFGDDEGSIGTDNQQEDGIPQKPWLYWLHVGQEDTSDYRVYLSDQLQTLDRKLLQVVDELEYYKAIEAAEEEKCNKTAAKEI